MMKRFACLFFSCALLLLAFACNDIETIYPETVSSPLPGRFAGLEFFMDTTQSNKFKADAFCKDWEFSSAQVEVWVDGKLKEIRDVDNIFPYLSLSFQRGGLMTAQGMSGKWHYCYNFLMIDVLNSGGSIYWYEVDKVNGSKLILRAEDYPVGGPVVTFRQNPAGTHYFHLFTYVRK